MLVVRQEILCLENVVDVSHVGVTYFGDVDAGARESFDAIELTTGDM
jgi:hypothetical protein